MVLSLDYLRNQLGFDNWTAVLIGDLDSQPDDTVNSFESIRAESFGLIEGLSGIIKHYTRLPHHEVVSVMQQSHYILHPTLQDTYGYVVIEAMSCGCVPITCRIRAIEEIVDHGTSGFLLDVKTDENGNPKRFLSETMWYDVESQLKNVLTTLITESTMDEYQCFAAAARRRIELFHSPEVHSSELLKLYRRSLQ